MPFALTPRVLRRGLELFAVISLAGVAGLLFYGNNFRAFLNALLGLHWGWLAAGVGLASMDWIGGGARLWVLARHVRPGVRLRDMVIAGGMSAWAAYLTPFQTGAGPTMMWAMRRAGVRLPEAMTSTFMTFVATVAFFALAGPLAIYLGAGKSLAAHNVVLGITYYGLFRTSLTIFGILGVLMLAAMVFPAWLRDAVHWLAGRLERRSRRIAAQIEQLRAGIDRAHECMVAFGTPRGWLALGGAALGAVARQQTAGGLRGAARPRHPRQLRGHPPAPNLHHLPALLRAHPRGVGARRAALGRRDVHLRAPRHHPHLHPHLAVHQQLRHRDRGLAAVRALAAPGAGGARGGGLGRASVKGCKPCFLARLRDAA